MKSLSEELRPRIFEDIIDQDSIVNLIKSMINKNQLEQALYFYSEQSGLGKTSLARIIGRRVNCLNPQGHNPCNECSNCVTLLEDPKGLPQCYIEFACAEEGNKAVLLDRMKQWTTIQSPTGYRVILLDEVHALSGAAQDALLLDFESLYINSNLLKVYFIVATREPTKLKSAFVSRLMPCRFNPLKSSSLCEMIKNIAEKANLEYDDEGLELIAEASDGSARVVYRFIEKFTIQDINITGANVAEQLGTLTFNQRIIFWNALKNNEWRLVNTIWSTWIDKYQPADLGKALLKDLAKGLIYCIPEQILAIKNISIGVINNKPELIKAAIFSLQGVDLSTINYSKSVDTTLLLGA